MRHCVEVRVNNGVDPVVTITRLTLRTMLGNLIMGHHPMILIPGSSVESVKITESS